MSEPKPINLLENPTVWTGPAVIPKPSPLETHTDPLTGLPFPFTPGGEALRKAGLGSPTINLTPEQQKQLQDMMAAGKAARGNSGKPRWSLLALEVFEPVVRVLMFGAKKYAAWNFATGKGLSWTETGECMQRHLNAWMRGEDNDPESGESHLGHIGCNLMFLLYYRMYASKGYAERDDRNKR